jgi:hypothetical protein
MNIVSLNLSKFKWSDAYIITATDADGVNHIDVYPTLESMQDAVDIIYLNGNRPKMTIEPDVMCDMIEFK